MSDEDTDESPVMVEHPSSDSGTNSSGSTSPITNDNEGGVAVVSPPPSSPAAAAAAAEDNKNASKDDVFKSIYEAQPDTQQPEQQDQPEALQIVSIGTEENEYAFTFHEEQLNLILSKIPLGWNVSVISVVGAFRTGKSFLLSWFLRYLHYLQKSQKEEKSNKNTNKNDDKKETKKWYNEFQSLGKDGFDWRGGSVRNTTGIWMWSEPYFIDTNDSTITGNDQMAVLLVDTQGMFDHETTMALTASIFGLSTLLSSYQIYNVDKRIQEDNLQQLALFSEYAKTAVNEANTNDTNEEDNTTSTEENSNKKEDDNKPKPFQKIEFLIRDWQHFDDDDDDSDDDSDDDTDNDGGLDFGKMEKSVDTYLQTAIANRNAKDLQDTREQILGCFENISAYAMTHPGFAVTKKKYNGDVKAMDPIFLQLLDRYCNRVFNPNNLKPKVIHGRTITSIELGSYIKAYAELFVTGAHFPEASTLLEATATANNTNAIHLAIAQYKEEMDRVAGPHCSNYVNPTELAQIHEEILQKNVLTTFKDIANFGSQRDIKSALQKLYNQVEERFEMYDSLNTSRNPLHGLEIYLVPMSIAMIAFLFRWLADSSCSGWSDVCKKGSDVLSHIYAVAFCFMAIVAFAKAKQIKELFHKVKAGFDAMNNANANSGGSSGQTGNKKEQ